MNGRLITIARFKDGIQAELAKQTLEDFGINAILSGQNAAVAFGGVYAAVDIELQVPESQAKEAIEILQSEDPSTRRRTGQQE
jgi:hypothetical protein